MNGVESVGCRDEEDIREVERGAQEVISELIILVGIQNFEKC